MTSKYNRLGSLLTEEILTLLSETFPHRCADPKDTEREIWMKAGERRLVDVLIAKYNEMQEEYSITNLPSSED